MSELAVKEGDVTFLDVPAEVYDASPDCRHESVGDLLLGPIIATEKDDEGRIVGHSRRTEDGPSHKVTVRDGSDKRVEFA